MSFDINVLVNGSRCKLYNHLGKTFVEAKEGSEYVVEIKNNSWEKILAVVSVDSLNILNGEAADENGPGYVLDKYTSQKFYGYQYSQDKVATFKFGAFGAVKIDPATGKPEIDPATGKEIPLGYAASKQDGSEKNAGVIGVVIWDEVPQPTPLPPTAPSGGLYGPGRYGYNSSGLSSSFALTSSYAITSYAVSSSWCSNYSPDPTQWGTAVWTSGSALLPNQNARVYSAVSGGTCCSSGDKFDLANMVEDCYIPVKSATDIQPPVLSFDMETQWGESKQYKVKEITFERKNIIYRFDIYYASRESLIAMGVDLGTEKRVNFPESFKPSKYAKPPKGWKG